MTIELDPDIAKWLKHTLEQYILSARAYPSVNMQDQLNAQLVIGKIIEEANLIKKGKTVRLSGRLSDRA